MRVGVGYSDNPDSFTAGKQAITEALSKVGQAGPCDFVLLFCTARHEQQNLRNGVVSVVGNFTRIYGGGAVGIITNDKFGYAGDQVGVACFWLEDSACTILVEGNMDQGEKETGIRLGKRLLKAGITADSPMLLFYDAINRTNGDVRLLMATWLIEGLELGLGFPPDLNGGGMQGDHACTSTMQYIGEELGKHVAISLAFSDDIRMDSIIVHGCRPASPYYTVTKADGPAILEIDGTPALQFMDKLLNSSIAPEDYPFFLLFGLNHGERWGEYDEDNYASRLCLDIDKERGAIIMFEPDMTEGTEFRLMYRSLELDYMRPRLESVFSRLKGREPVFAVYIDCAGRCAGYGGIDIEDAHVVQEIVGNRVPLLGLYTGAEISRIGGRPRGLDWTGVFCVFSKASTGKQGGSGREDGVRWETIPVKTDKSKDIPLEAVLKLCEQNAVKILELDTRSIAIRHELEHKRRGFSLLAELSISLRQGTASENLFLLAAQRINAALNMHKTIVLLLNKEGQFVPHILQGYSLAEKEALAGRSIDIDVELLNPEKAVLVTAADEPERLFALRKTLGLPYFISVPVVIENRVIAVLIAGRMEETPPFLSRLGHGDIETLQAISSLLASVWVYRRLDVATKQAQSDGLTGLLNRSAFEMRSRESLQRSLEEGLGIVLAIIDCDHFKLVNDTYGHLAGDMVLSALADSLRENFRHDDLVSRIGGDEFAICCPIVAGEAPVINKIAQLAETWSKTPFETDEGTIIYSTLSIGITVAPKDGTAYDKLFHFADIALYKAKQQGRNRYAIYDARDMGHLSSTP